MDNSDDPILFGNAPNFGNVYGGVRWGGWAIGCSSTTGKFTLSCVDGNILMGYHNDGAGIDPRTRIVAHYSMYDKRDSTLLYDSSARHRHGNLSSSTTLLKNKVIEEWLPTRYYMTEFDNTVSAFYATLPVEDTPGEFFEIDKSFGVSIGAAATFAPQVGNQILCGTSFDGSVPGWYVGYIDDKLTICFWTDAANWKRWTVLPDGPDPLYIFNLYSWGQSTQFFYDHVTGQIRLAVMPTGSAYSTSEEGLSYLVPAGGSALVEVTSAGVVTTIANKNLFLGTAAGATHAENMNGDCAQCVFYSGDYNYWSWANTNWYQY